MKQDYTMYIYKTDRRTKTSERLYSTTVWTGRDEAGMQREVEELHLHHYPRSQFRMEYIASMKTVKNLMSGKDIQIPHDTPRSCDPSSELYWSM
jgi:outer membrane protein assembly factor BamD (BamD/ComL family)